MAMSSLHNSSLLLRRRLDFKLFCSWLSINPLAGIVCAMSTNSADGKPQAVGKNLSFRPASRSPFDANNRPIVLIYGWLVAKAKHIYKYGDFYLGKGFDVLHIKVEPFQLLWPKQAQQVVAQVSDFIMDPRRCNQPIVVHGFSVGGYLYGETIVKFMSDRQRFQGMDSRVRGQIFDSPVDFEGVPNGVGLAVTANPILQKTIGLSLEAYLKVFRNLVTQHYKRSSEMFHLNPLRSPSLVFYSRNDPIGRPGPIETVMQNWRRQDIPVSVRCWDETPHVSHFLHHPVQYIGALNAFLDSIGLQQNNSSLDKAAIAKL